MVNYRDRIVDDLTAHYLGALGGVVLEGPRACGKTSTGLHHAKSSVRLDSSPQLIELAELSPTTLLKGPTPRLLDEWQLAPTLWNAVRHEIDIRQAPGQFILSGSATPADDLTRHSGAGRLARLRMRPMALAESGHSSGAISLATLMQGDTPVSARSPLGYEDLAQRAVIGGWPALLDASSEDAQIFNQSYCDELCHADIASATGIHHAPLRLQRLLLSLSRNLATEASLSRLSADVAADEDVGVPKTIRTYMDALTSVFALEELSPWSPSLRSRSRLRHSSTIHLADPALACAALGVGPRELAKDPEFFGFVFEAMAIRDLRVYAQAQRGEVFRYRDNTGLEVDAIIAFPDGNWAALEVKLGSTGVAAAEAHLLSLAQQRVDTAKESAPKFLAVITATEYAYTLRSGVHVIPLAVLNS